MRIYVAGTTDAALDAVEVLREHGHDVIHTGPDRPAQGVGFADFELVLIFEQEYLGPLKQPPDVFAQSEAVCMLHESLADALDPDELADLRVDDLFHDTADLERRLPFVARRVDLRDARSREYAAIFELTVDGIIVIDKRGTVRAYNRAAEKIFGYESSEVVGQNITLLMPTPYAEEHDRYISRYLETGRKKIIGIGREVSGRRKNGEVFPMDLAVSEVPSEGDILFTGLVRDITNRRQLEHEILRISEQERRRIGQDLHDGLGQMLTGLRLITQNLARRLKKKDSESAEEIEEVSELIHEADQMARNLARGLVPVELQGDGISAAMRRLCVSVERLFGITCRYEEEGRLDVEDSGMAANLYRITQEAVSNAVKHGKASNVIVRFERADDELQLEILDDGVGFPDQLGEDRGMGVRIMGYRARVIGAVLDIRTRPEGGTAVTCSLSLAEPIEENTE